MTVRTTGLKVTQLQVAGSIAVHPKDRATVIGSSSGRDTIQHAIYPFNDGLVGPAAIANNLPEDSQNLIAGAVFIDAKGGIGGAWTPLASGAVELSVAPFSNATLRT